MNGSHDTTYWYTWYKHCMPLRWTAQNSSIHDIAGFSPGKIEGRVNGCGLGRVCGHINHFGSHINIEGSCIGGGGVMLKRPGENTELYSGLLLLC